jgi:hypothetical protein
MRQPVTPGWGILALLAAFLVCITAEVRAEFVQGSISVSSPPPIAGFEFTHTIDQSGLSIPYVSGVTDFGTYVGAGPTHTGTPGTFGATFSLPPQNFDFDLGAAYTVQHLAFWNYPFPNSGGVRGLEVFTSNVANFSSSFPAGVFSPADDATGGNVNAVQVFDLIDSNARYVRLRVTAVASPVGIGFSEVAFGATFIPEPASLATLCLGAAALATTMTRRCGRQSRR